MTRTVSNDSGEAAKGGCRSWNWPGIRTVIGSVLLMLYLGCFFLWGNISIYVLSYFHDLHPTASYGFIFLVDAILVTANWTGYQIGSYLFQSRRWHPKLLLGLGGAVSLTGVYLSSLTTDVGEYLACYCLLNGLGCGTCYIIPLICGWEWFPEKKGLVTGCVLGGYGFGSFIFAQVSTKLVNPNGENPTIKDPDNPNITFYDKEVSDRVPYMIQTLVYIWACLVFVGVVLIERKPLASTQTSTTDMDPLEEVVAEEYQETTTDPTATTFKTSAEKVPDLLTSDNIVNKTHSCLSEKGELGKPMLSDEDELKIPNIKAVKFFWYSLRFWQYFAMMILANYFGTFFSYSYKTFGENTSPHPQISDSLLTWAASIGAGFVNGLSRIVMGSLVDKYSFRFLMGSLMFVQLVNSLVCFWAAYVPALYFICVLVNYFVIGGMYTIFPVSVQNCFGLEFGPQIYVQISFGSVICAYLNLFSTKYLLEVTNFVTLFYVGSLTQFATLVLLYFFKEELDVKNLEKRGGIKLVAVERKPEFAKDQN